MEAGTESNRRMGLLQSPALPLGYPAIFEVSSFKRRGEAEVGIEPTHRAFAEPGLPTWQLRRSSNEAATNKR